MEFEPEKHNCSALLFSHIVLKGAQAGSIIGAATAAPSLAAMAYNSGASAVTPALTVEMLTNRSGRGLGIGLVAVSALGAIKMASLDKEGIEDRAYRLHYNEAQQRCDRFWSISTLLGAALGYASGGATKVVGSAALAGASGIFLHSLTWAPKDD